MLSTNPFLPPRIGAPDPSRHVALGLVLIAATLGGLALLAPALAVGRDALVTDETLARAAPLWVLVVMAALLVLACLWTDRGVPAASDDGGAGECDDADRD